VTFWSAAAAFGGVNDHNASVGVYTASATSAASARIGRHRPHRRASATSARGHIATSANIGRTGAHRPMWRDFDFEIRIYNSLFSAFL
jgi:hypothetical protein